MTKITHLATESREGKPTPPLVLGCTSYKEGFQNLQFQWSFMASNC